MKSDELKKKWRLMGYLWAIHLDFFMVLRQHYLERRRWG